jgi:uncharacterized protein YejL (UPF0352 family)
MVDIYCDSTYITNIRNDTEKVSTMTKFAKFDKANLKALRAEMQAVLEKYGMSSNLEIEVGNMRFSNVEVEIKVKAKVKGAKTRTDAMLESMAKMSGLKLTNSYGDMLVEYSTRARKMPWVYKCGKTGKMFKTDERGAKMRFAA